MPQRGRPFSLVYAAALALGLPSLATSVGCGGVVATAGDAGAVDGGVRRDAMGLPADVVVSRDAAMCDDAACGPNPFGAPNIRCADGSVGGPTCGGRAGDACGWYLRDCPATPDAGAACALPDGGTCAEGAACPAPDGCNTCTCSAGRLLACTERACAIDAGMSCVLRDGRTCAIGASCPASDGCNTCSCEASGRAVCTHLACPPDAGVTDLGAADAGAPDAEPCVIDCAAPPPGCRYEGPITCEPPSCGRLVCADAGAEIVCGASDRGSFPTFDRSCGAATDCVVALHQTDCCGSRRAMGINAGQRDAFNRAEAVCRPMYRECGCPAGIPTTDDGASADPFTTIPVECRTGTCTTFRRP